MREILTGLAWTDVLIFSVAFALAYKLLFPKQQPTVRLTPNELRNVLEIQARRKEFSASSWIAGQQEFPKVRGRLWQCEARLGGVR